MYVEPRQGQSVDVWLSSNRPSNRPAPSIRCPETQQRLAKRYGLRRLALVQAFQFIANAPDHLAVEFDSIGLRGHRQVGAHDLIESWGLFGMRQ
jgi:hypothetical protein